ncbi:MAG: anthrax toxin lethal factor-related metalloendopeptidase [Dehalococcoidia bacterium]
MIRFAAYLLPVVALAAVAAMVVFSLEEREDSTSAPAADEVAPAATPTTSRPRFEPGQTVCQGVLHRADPGQPRVFHPVYTQRETVAGIEVIGGAGVSPEAFATAKKTIETMFAGNDLAAPLVEEGVYVIIAESGQGILDLPEFACLEQQFGARFFERVCGIADRADYPVATVNEDDLLGKRSGPCAGLNILYHELGHVIQNWSLGPADWFDIKQYYQDAITAGAYRGTYAATNPDEYFAEATQAYFLRTSYRTDREWLERRDPKLFTLLERVYGPR